MGTTRPAGRARARLPSAAPHCRRDDAEGLPSPACQARGRQCRRRGLGAIDEGAGNDPARERPRLLSPGLPQGSSRPARHGQAPGSRGCPEATGSCQPRTPPTLRTPSTSTTRPTSPPAWRSGPRFTARSARLPKDQRVVFRFHYFADLSQSEIARLLDLHPKQVSRLWLAATVRLAHRLDGLEEFV